MLIGAVCGGLLGLVIGPLIARYSGIFFGMLTLALSMVFYGALVKIHRARRLRRLQCRPAEPVRHESLPIRARPISCCMRSRWSRPALPASPRPSCSDPNSAWSSLAVRENNLRVEYLGLSANRIIAINFVIAAVFAGASGAFALMAQRHIDPQFAYWTTSGEFVFVAVLAGYQSVAAVFVASMALELVRSFSNLYLPNTWQLVLGVFLLAVILFLPRGIGSLWVRGKRRTVEPAAVERRRGQRR